VRVETSCTLADFPLLPLTYDDLEVFVTKTLPEIGVSVEDVEDAYQCSPIQRGILLSQARHAAHYEVRATWEVVASANCPPVDMKRLEDAWWQVVARHAALRTIFVESSSTEGYRDQVVLRHVSPEITRVKCADSDPLAVLNNHRQTSRRKGQLPHRLTLCETANGDVFCMLEISHAVSDATSIAVLKHDLCLAYDARLPAEQGPLYRDYVSYIQLQPQDAASQYWKAYLDGVQPCHFPKTGSLRRNDSTSLQHVNITLRNSAKINDFCKAKDVTMSNLFSMAWALVLQCFTGSDDVCFGYLSSGRDLPIRGIQDAVGPFINMLVCRVDLDRDATVGQITQKIQDDYLHSLPHQTFSLADMGHLIGMSGQALFNTAISLQRLSATQGTDETTIDLKAVGGRDPTEVSLAYLCISFQRRLC
jgi:hypothetical protein